MLRLFFSLFLILVLSACQSPLPHNAPNPPPSLPLGKSEQVQALAQEYFQFEQEQSPIFRSDLGLSGQFEWDDISQEATDHQLSFYQELRQKLLAIPEQHLDVPSAIIYRSLLAELNFKLLNAAFASYQDAYLQARWDGQVVNTLIYHHPFSSISDAQDYIKRLKAIPSLFKRWQENIKIAADQAVFANDFTYSKVRKNALDMLNGAPFNNEGQAILWADFNNKLDNLGLYRNTRILLENQAKTALEKAGEAYLDLAKFLTKLSKDAPKQQGLHHLDEGLHYYQTLLNWYSASDMDASTMSQLGMSEISRLQNEIKNLMPRLGYEDVHFSAFVKDMNNKAPHFKSDKTGRNELIQYQQDLLNNLSLDLANYITVLPKTSLAVVPILTQQNTKIAFYQVPALLGNRPGLYFINLSRMASLPQYSLPAIAMREAIGPHLQAATVIEQNSNDYLRSRRNPAFVKGWSLYSATLGREMGSYKTPEEEYGSLMHELILTCALVVDTGLNSGTMSIEEAKQFLLKNTALNAQESQQLIESYLTYPAQAVAYKMGELRILSLRQQMQDKLGVHFNLAKFHLAILSQGALPFYAIDLWLPYWANQEIKHAK